MHDWNPATPNDAYFKSLDTVVRLAREQDFILVILPCGGSGGSFVQRKQIITAANARAYGRWLGNRYRDQPHVVWSNGFDLKPWLFEEVAHEFAAGLREGDASGRLITYHPCGGATSAHFHHEPWLAANFIQTWADFTRIHPMVYHDFLRPPPKPVVHVEGAYGAPSTPPAPITPLLVRQQAYWSYLSGGFHTYGHNDLWRCNPTWRTAIDSPGPTDGCSEAALHGARLVEAGPGPVRVRPRGRRRKDAERGRPLHGGRRARRLPRPSGDGDDPVDDDHRRRLGARPLGRSQVPERRPTPARSPLPAFVHSRCLRDARTRSCCWTRHGDRVGGGDGTRW